MAYVIYLFLIIGVIAFILNIYATLEVFKSTIYDTRQKIRQALFIWVAPFFGSAFALYLLNQSKTPSDPPRSKKEMEVEDSEFEHTEDLDSHE